MAKRKWILFVTTITLTGIIVVLGVSEMLLRFKKQHIESSDHLDKRSFGRGFEGKWFYPNEGHRIVYDILLPVLQ